MDCHDVTNYLLTADNESSLPAEIERHLNHCGQCSREFGRFMEAVAILQADSAGSAVTTNPALTARVMGAVRREMVPAGEEQPTALKSWVIVGSILLAGLFGLRFSDVMSWLRLSFGPAIDIAMSVILGVYLTAYLCLLVGSNLPRVRRLLRLE